MAVLADRPEPAGRTVAGTARSTATAAAAARRRWMGSTRSAGQGPGQPENRRSRKPLFIALAAAVVIAAGLITWLAWRSRDPQFTYHGKEIASVGTVLSKVEANVDALVKKRHGAKNSDTRCYYAQSKKAAPGVQKSDGKSELHCGPVLFVDGDTARSYLSVPLRSRSSSGEQTELEASTSLDSLQPQSVSSDLKLARPDGKQAPKGVGGLKLPEPQAAAADLLISADLDPTSPPRALTGAVMTGRARRSRSARPARSPATARMTTRVPRRRGRN